MSYKIVTLAGDGIGPEIMDSAIKVLEATGIDFNFIPMDFGGVAIDNHGMPLPEETLKVAKSADAILHGAIGHPKFDDKEVRPEQGLLQIRKELGLFANIRPVKIFEGLEDASPIKNVENVDFVVVRELTGGLYFGEKKLEKDVATDTCVYTRSEVERIARVAFELARTRRKHVTSVDKQNVLATSKLWRQVVDEIAKDYPDVTLHHQLVDSCAMLLITNPSQFDVILTENLFGDILSDEAAAIAGTLGVMPSSSLGSGTKLYEPIHGSAPDIAGQNKANPVGMILSAAMMLEDLKEFDAATLIKKAVSSTLKSGVKTTDLSGQATTADITNEIIKRMEV